MLRLLVPLFVAALAIAIPAHADGPADNLPDNVRPIPPRGNALPETVRDELRKGLAELQGLIKDIGTHDLLPDALIYEKAVLWALDYDEVYDAKNTKTPGGNVRKVLAAGLERAKQLKDGKTPWTSQTGPVLRGYRSKIDGSIQPYWLIVPKDYDFNAQTKHRLDFWWHGRGETLSEANFMAAPAVASGIIPAPSALILHPYGRYCNANKFAGEIDSFECLEHAKKHYRIDENRLVARGFSMGGAACWQFGVHYPSLWAACAPGAGFAETPEFLNNFQNETVKPTWYEEKLWRMYNATDYAENLFNLPTVAYSGEIDRQKQAADVMARELLRENIELTHIIGPKTGHAYEKGARVEVNKRIDSLLEGYNAPVIDIMFTTWTLRYNHCHWLRVDGLERHWEQARVTGSFSDYKGLNLTTKNVSSLTIQIPAGRMTPVVSKGRATWQMPFVIDDQKLPPPMPRSDRSLEVTLEKVDGKWHRAAPVAPGTLTKQPGLQGPIDDAFMDAFINVKPTGKPMNAKVSEWVEKEMKHAVDQWRKQFRGDAPVKSDTEITDADMRNNNLALWGDPSNNKLLAKMADKLPVNWTDKGVQLGEKTYDAGSNVPILIYPNPLNPKKYVVLNSGFTFREYDQLNNARQVPKLPDYAIIDITTPPNSRYPGKVVRAGFFGEKWELLPDDGKR